MRDDGKAVASGSSTRDDGTEKDNGSGNGGSGGGDGSLTIRRGEYGGAGELGTVEAAPLVVSGVRGREVFGG